MESTAEFEMMHNGNLELFEAFFTWEAWKDGFDSSDSSSEYWDWSHVLIRLSYLTEDGDTIKLLPSDYQALLPELKDFVKYNINAQIESELY